MLTKVLNNIREFCSLQPPKGASKNHWKGGFTLVELMVVIIIVNLLSGVAIPKLTYYVEKTKQKIDLMKLFYLRDALNRAMYEADVLDIDEKQKCDGVTNNKDNLSKWLASDEGVTLFIIELHDKLAINYQAKNNKRFTDAQNMCGVLSGGGFWADAFKDAGFGAVADILYARDHTVGGKIQSGATYDAYPVKINGSDWWRTHPRQPIFISRALNGDASAPLTASKIGGQNRYKFKTRWTNKNEKSHSLEVFIANAQGADYGKPYTTRQGVCFSTETALCN
jgi:prepilin-type N-terminal cleavage/methylation domain-containing protein